MLKRTRAVAIGVSLGAIGAAAIARPPELSFLVQRGIAEFHAFCFPIENPSDAAKSVAAEDLELHFERLGKWDWRGSLTNRSHEPIVFVTPGDGSDFGMRTPFVDWTHATTEGEPLEARSVGRCGNMAPLRADEIVVLAPGETSSFEVPSPLLIDTEDDAVLVSLRLTNDPYAPWSELSGSHEPGAMAALRKSTAFTVESQPVRFER